MSIFPFFTQGQSMTLNGFSVLKNADKVLNQGSGPWTPVENINTVGAYFQLKKAVNYTETDKNLVLEFFDADGDLLERVATQGRIALFFEEGFLFFGDVGPNQNLPNVVTYLFLYEPLNGVNPITVTSFIMP